MRIRLQARDPRKRPEPMMDLIPSPEPGATAQNARAYAYPASAYPARQEHRALKESRTERAPHNPIGDRQTAPHRVPYVTSHFHGHIHRYRALAKRTNGERLSDARDRRYTSGQV